VAIALVAHTKWSPGAVGGTSPNIDTTGADFIVIAMNWNVPTGEPALSDNKGNGAPTKLTSQIQTNHGTRFYYWTNPTVGAGHNFTAATGGDYGSYVAAFSGVATSSPFDKETGGHTANSITAIQCAAGLDSTNNNSLFLSAVGIISNSTSPTEDTSFTTIDNDIYSGGVVYGGGLFYRVEVGNAGSLNPTASWLGSSTESTIVFAVFAPSVAAFNPGAAYGATKTIGGVFQ
jgi:hypothetical protein